MSKTDLEQICDAVLRLDQRRKEEDVRLAEAESRIALLGVQVKALAEQVARLQDVKQCEECLELHGLATYGDHKCMPVALLKDIP